jgi:hypothetical protein
MARGRGKEEVLRETSSVILTRRSPQRFSQLFGQILDLAEAEHSDRAAAIRVEAEALERRSQTEEARWDKERERLTSALKRARG